MKRFARAPIAEDARHGEDELKRYALKAAAASASICERRFECAAPRDDMNFCECAHRSIFGAIVACRNAGRSPPFAARHRLFSNRIAINLENKQKKGCSDCVRENKVKIINKICQQKTNKQKTHNKAKIVDDHRWRRATQIAHWTGDGAEERRTNVKRPTGVVKDGNRRRVCSRDVIFYVFFGFFFYTKMVTRIFFFPSKAQFTHSLSLCGR